MDKDSASKVGLILSVVGILLAIFRAAVEINDSQLMDPIQLTGQMLGLIFMLLILLLISDLYKKIS
jgi:hypothetical protein